MRGIPSHSSDFRVSILVVMDLALQPAIAATAPSYMICFNPCCNGFSVATATQYGVLVIEGNVSILVVMDLALQRGDRAR